MFIVGGTNIIILFLIEIIIDAMLGAVLSCIAFTDIASASTTAVLFRLIELRTHFVPNSAAFTSVTYMSVNERSLPISFTDAFTNSKSIFSHTRYNIQIIETIKNKKAFCSINHRQNESESIIDFK